MAAFISGVRSIFGRSTRAAGPDAMAILASSSPICRSSAITSGHRGWTREARARSTTAIRGPRDAAWAGASDASELVVGCGGRPPHPTTSGASASHASARTIRLLAADRLDDLVGQVDPAVEDDLAAQHDRDALAFRDLFNGGADVLLEAADQLLALLEQLLVDLTLDLLALGRRHRLHSLLRVGDLRLRIILERRLRARLAGMGLDRPGHVHIPDRQRLPERRAGSGDDEPDGGHDDDHRRRDADGLRIPPHPCSLPAGSFAAQNCTPVDTQNCWPSPLMP